MIKVALIGNPNVGKSTLFNELTNSYEHTGNWTGKTVEYKIGYKKYKNELLEIYDLPGTYSLIPCSLEEEITSNFILDKKYDVALVVCDPLCLERNLNLVLQTLEVSNNVLVCINMVDELLHKDVSINYDMLSKILNTKVVNISARDKIGIDNLLDSILDLPKSNHHIKYDDKVEECISIIDNYTNSRFESIKTIICGSNDKVINEKVNQINKYLRDNNINFNDSVMNEIINICEDINNKVVIKKEYKINYLDKILLNKITGIPIMIAILMIILWISIIGANYPSNLLLNIFNSIGVFIKEFLININVPNYILLPFIDGIYKVLTWVISVMLPPMSIFYLLFTLSESFGILPRIVFNLDGYFENVGTSGKQALTMCMGVGCNSIGVMGTRIIDSKRERLIAILTNVFMPCNGRFPTLIMIFSMFFSITSNSLLNTTINVLLLTIVILISILITFLVSKILSKTLLKGKNSFFILEMPQYRNPKINKEFIKIFLDKIFKTLYRTILVSAPAGLLIWILNNIYINNISIALILSKYLNSFGMIIGLDGVIVLSFILGFTANEIVLPIIIMIYQSSSVIASIDNINVIRNLFINNGWTIITSICMIVFILFHFPCSTTLISTYKETKSLKWTILSFIIPLLIGILLCSIINFIGNMFI